MELVQRNEVTQHLNGLHMVEEVAECPLLKIKLDVHFIDSAYLNSRYCHAHWRVEDVTDTRDINHAAWYFDVDTKMFVIVGAIPNHTYRIYYGDVLFS